MKSFVAILAVVAFALAFLSVETSGAKFRRGHKLGHNGQNDKCPVVFGPSKDAFKKNLPQDFCSIFKNGGSLKQADGTQIFTGVCSNTPQGAIPTVDNMPSSLIISPGGGEKIKRNEKFTVKVLTKKLELGHFSDPTIQYNAFPQILNNEGLIQGHQHVTIQFLGEKIPKIPDTKIFAFFKGLNDPSGNGILEVTVDQGLPQKGIYRVCTIISSFSHQPIVLPKAQRGASDDCVRIEVE